MAKNKGKQFQSGREIMETFIPGYRGTLSEQRIINEEVVSESQDTQAAQQLLHRFRTKLERMNINWCH